MGIDGWVGVMGAGGDVGVIDGRKYRYTKHL